LHLLTFDHPQKSTLVFLDLFLFLSLYIFCLLLALTGDGQLPLQQTRKFCDPEKLYRLRRREAQSKKLEFADPNAEAEGSSGSPKESPPPSPRENQLPPQPMGEQPQP
jgi:hypothetical protein